MINCCVDVLSAELAVPIVGTVSAVFHCADVHHVRCPGHRADRRTGTADGVRNAHRRRVSGVWHHSRAHRFFSTARWNLDQVGLIVLNLIMGWLTPVGAPMVVAVDDTLFRRNGRRVHGACWAYDGSRKVAAGSKKLSRGTTFVVAAVVVELPFLDRPIAWPVLARLWRPGGPTKPALTRELIRVIAAARRDRAIHVVVDGAYVCTTLRHLPANVTLTGPLPRHATLAQVHPDVDNPPCLRGKRGRTRTRGEKIGTPTDLATATTSEHVTVTRYGRRRTITVHHRRCLWPGVFWSRPGRILVIREPRGPGLALLTTDTTASIQQIVEHYAARWSIEVAFADARQTTGVGEARSCTRPAVERTVPFGFLVQSLVVIWYHLVGHSPKVVAEHRGWARWYASKTHPSYLDMLVKLRRVGTSASRRSADTAAMSAPQDA